MTLIEIIELVKGEYGSRMQVSTEQVITFIDQIQKIAFSKDLNAFINFDNYITIDPNNPKGPYSWAGITPEVRKMVGVTSASDAMLTDPYSQNVVTNAGWGEANYYPDSFGNQYPQGTDYGFVDIAPNPRRLFASGRLNQFSKTFKFNNDAPSTEPQTWRWYYYFRPPTIANINDDANLLIPEEWHHTLVVQGAIALADNTTFAEKQPLVALEPYLEPFWESFMDIQDPNEGNTYSEGQP